MIVSVLVVYVPLLHVFVACLSMLAGPRGLGACSGPCGRKGTALATRKCKGPTQFYCLHDYAVHCVSSAWTWF